MKTDAVGNSNVYVPEVLLMDTHNICFHGEIRKISGCPLFISSPVHEVLKVSCCGQSMSICIVRHQQFALKAYSSYTPGPLDSKLGRKHRVDL